MSNSKALKVFQISIKFHTLDLIFYLSINSFHNFVFMGMREGFIFDSKKSENPDKRTSLEAKTEAEDILRKALVASIPDRDNALLAAMIATGSRIDALEEVLRNPINWRTYI